MYYIYVYISIYGYNSYMFTFLSLPLWLQDRQLKPFGPVEMMRLSLLKRAVVGSESMWCRDVMGTSSLPFGKFT